MQSEAPTTDSSNVVADVLDVVSGNKPVQTANTVSFDISMRTIGKIALGVLLIAAAIKVSQMVFGTN